MTVQRAAVPMDVIDIELFFKEYFTGCPKEVFKRFCECHELDMIDTLEMYRNWLRWDTIYPDKTGANLTEEMDNPSQCVFRLLK